MQGSAAPSRRRSGSGGRNASNAATSSNSRQAPLSPKRKGKRSRIEIDVANNPDPLIVQSPERNIFNSKAESGYIDDRSSQIEPAMYYALAREFGLPLFVGPNGQEQPRPASVRADGPYKPAWYIGDRNRDLQIAVLGFAGFHVIDDSPDRAPKTAECTSHMNQIETGPNGSKMTKDLVDMYRGAIFSYRVRGKPTARGRPIVDVSLIYSPKTIVYRDIAVINSLADCEKHMRMEYPIEGTVLRVFKYGGSVCYSTGAFINGEYCTHPFSPDYKQIYRMLGGPSEADLFGASETNTHVHVFKLVHPATGQLSPIPFKEFIVYEGTERLDVQGDSTNYYDGKGLREHNYFDLIHNSTQNNVILGPIRVRPLDYGAVKRMVANALNPAVPSSTLDKPVYLLGMWSESEELEYGGQPTVVKQDYIVKFTSPDYESRAILRGPTQNVMSQFIDIIALYEVLYRIGDQYINLGEIKNNETVTRTMAYKGAILYESDIHFIVQNGLTYSNDFISPFDLVAAIIRQITNVDRVDAISTYSALLHAALNRMHAAAATAFPYRPNETVFNARRFGDVPLASHIYTTPDVQTLTQAEVYLSPVIGQYQRKHKAAESLEYKFNLSEADYTGFVAKYHQVILNNPAFQGLSPADCALHYIRSSITDVERTRGVIIESRGEYISAKRVLEFFLNAPL